MDIAKIKINCQLFVDMFIDEDIDSNKIDISFQAKYSLCSTAS